jgi:hypothetical protein
VKNRALLSAHATATCLPKRCRVFRTSDGPAISPLLPSPLIVSVRIGGKTNQAFFKVRRQGASMSEVSRCYKLLSTDKKLLLLLLLILLKTTRGKSASCYRCHSLPRNADKMPVHVVWRAQLLNRNRQTPFCTIPAFRDWKDPTPPKSPLLPPIAQH